MKELTLIISAIFMLGIAIGTQIPFLVEKILERVNKKMCDCENCKYFGYYAGKITGINTGDPPEVWCEKDSEAFYEEDMECEYQEDRIDD